jgi:SPP1 gp7 family putative phage head morphogenesis protein
MSIPEVFFRETIDLNRFSNAVAKKYAVTYNEVILNAAKQLREIDERQVAEIAKGGARIIAPQTRKRLRAIIKQAKDSLNTWSGVTARDFKKELQGITLLQRDFIVNELKKVTASGDVPINSVAISPKYAESVIMTDPTQINIFTTEQFKEDAFKRFGAGKFELTATQGSAVTLPNGETVNKAFRGIAASSQEKLALAIRSGVFSGETTQQIARRLVGDLNFADFGPLSVKQLAASGGELTKLANHQIQTIVRTSVNQVQNQASQAVYAANRKVAPKYEYVATLDSKTTPICQRLDGQQFAYNKGPTPPQHFNCRSTTVPVVDFDGLQKKYSGLEKPPETALDTRPSITGRVPQNVAYGDWLLNQKKDLQIKTLGNEQRVRFFKRLANKKGSSGQKALRQIIRTDGTEKTLDQIKKEYKL